MGWPPETAPTWTWRGGQWEWIRRIRMLAKSFCKTSRRRMGRIWDAAVAPGVFGSKHAMPVRRGGGMSPSMSIAFNKLRSMLCPVAVLPIARRNSFDMPLAPDVFPSFRFARARLSSSVARFGPCVLVGLRCDGSSRLSGWEWGCC